MPFIFEEKTWKQVHVEQTHIGRTVFSVLTWNVWFERDLERWRALIKEASLCSPTFICFQEVVSHFLDLLLQEDWVREGYWVSEYGLDEFGYYEILLGPRDRLAAIEIVPLPSRMGRRLVRAVYQDLTIATVHLESLAASTSRRIAQLELIFSSLPDQAILCGDFNFDATTGRERALIPHQWLDAWSLARPDDPGFTEDTAINRMRFLAKRKEKQVRFDRLLTKGRFLPSVQVPIRLVGVDPIGEDRWPSDHFGIFSSFERFQGVELHAHLSGSIPRSLLMEWAKEKGKEITLKGEPKTMDDAFQVFPLIRSLIQTLQDVQRATRHVVTTFYEQGCVYLELRTTPRQLMDAEPREYVQAVSEVLETAPMPCRLLLSIERHSMGITEAEQVVDLAIAFKDDGGVVVGVEMSGNPGKSAFSVFLPALKRARENGLLISVHGGEDGGKMDEMDEVLAFEPDRLGHCVFVRPEQKELIVQKGIPVEVCLTSNRFTDSIARDEDHPFLLEQQCVFCTDDLGVFGIRFDEEVARGCLRSGVSLKEMQRRGVEASFAEAGLKEKLLKGKG